MHAENIQAWMDAETCEYTQNPTHWEKVVAMIQAAFREGRLVEECTWNTTVLISKGNGDLCSIGRVEIL